LKSVQSFATDMTQLWLVPVDEQSYQRTLADPIDLGDRREKPDAFPDRSRVWGVPSDPERGRRERDQRNLQRMEPGDPLLIYRNSTGRYHAGGRVGPFWHTTYVRDEYWDGGPAVDVFAVREYEEIDADPETINTTLGYKGSFWPQGLWHVSDDRPTDRIVREFDL